MNERVREHYDELLAPIYSWTLGGFEARVTASAELLGELLAGRPSRGHALDLGCGTGVQTLALHRLGYEVTGVDFSSVMLSEYAVTTRACGARAILADLVEFEAPNLGAYSAAVCFGDTVSHLDSWSDVRAFFGNVARSLAIGGDFLLASRDHSRVYEGDDRFLLIRGDALRTMTCFVEDEGEHVRVTDVVHSQDSAAAPVTMRVSSYRKLRVAPNSLIAALAASGFSLVRALELANGVHVFHSQRSRP